MSYDVVIVGGGPSGLAAALTLGRARKRVLLCDAGPRRNAAAVHIHNFVTRDGTPPAEFRAIAREQLAEYPNVEVRDAGVESITGSRGAFEVALSSGRIQARRILLGTGMIDEPLGIDGASELWGHGIFQCPYCHGWEVRDRRWGYLVLPHNVAHMTPFAIQARGWTRDLVLFTNGVVEVPAEARATLEIAGIRIESTAIARLVGRDRSLEAVALVDGRTVPCDVLYAHPPQRQVELVRTLGLALDPDGFVQVDPVRRETSVPGIYAAGDLTSRMQAAIVAAALGMQTAAAINLELSMELAAAGLL